jgi:hypothetical protein
MDDLTGCSVCGSFLTKSVASTSNQIFVFCEKCNTRKIDVVLDTQEQRKAKGAAICPHCGVFCATDKEGM